MNFRFLASWLPYINPVVRSSSSCVSRKPDPHSRVRSSHSSIRSQAHTVTLQAKNMKASDLLNDVMARTGLTYDFRDNGIYVKGTAGNR